MASADSDAKLPVVIDHGSFQIQAGFGGDDAPRTVFRSIVGRLRHQGQLDELFAKLYQRDSYVGELAQKLRGVLLLRHPIERGVVTRWDDMEAIWNHTFTEELKFNPDDERVVLSQTPNNPKPNKDKMAEIFFEKFRSPGICLANQAALALYSSGKTSGLVVDCGHGVSHAVPIHQGIPLPPLHMDLAGSDLTDAMFFHLMDQGQNDRDSPRDIKEKLCYVALDPENESQKSSAPSDQNTYEYPDGETITLDSMRYKIPEALFKPSILKQDFMGIHEMAYNSISGLDSDVRKDLLSSVFIVGGSTLFPGFKERMQQELSTLAPSSVKVNVIAVPERKNSVWIGGAIFASRSDTESHWISKQEYEEIGPDVVHRKYL